MYHLYSRHLLRLGWLAGDSPRWLDEQVNDPRVDKTPRTEIVISGSFLRNLASLIWG